MGLLIDDYVDQRHVAQVNQALATRRDAAKQQLEARIARARTMLSQAQADALSPRHRKDWETRTFYVTSYQTSVECPACGGRATLHGDDVINTDVIYGPDDDGAEPDIQVMLTIAPIALHCDECRLDLSDYDLIVEAGLAEGFEVEGTGEDIAYEPEYNNE